MKRQGCVCCDVLACYRQLSWAMGFQDVHTGGGANQTAEQNDASLTMADACRGASLSAAPVGAVHNGHTPV